MKNIYSYHLSLHLSFNQDVDVDKLEKHFKHTAYKKTFLKDSKGNKKTAKIWYKSSEFTDVNTHEQIEKYLEKIYPDFIDLKEILQKYDGECVFSLIFTLTKERPIISLTTKTIQLMEKLGMSFDVDFI